MQDGAHDIAEQRRGVASAGKSLIERGPMRDESGIQVHVDADAGSFGHGVEVVDAPSNVVHRIVVAHGHDGLLHEVAFQPKSRAGDAIYQLLEGVKAQPFLEDLVAQLIVEGFEPDGQLDLRRLRPLSHDTREKLELFDVHVLRPRLEAQNRKIRQLLIDPDQ